LLLGKWLSPDGPQGAVNWYGRRVFRITPSPDNLY
jgi:hypothetical protein